MRTSNLLLIDLMMTSFSSLAQAQDCECDVYASVLINPLPTPIRVAGHDSRFFGPFTVTNLWSNFKKIPDGISDEFAWTFNIEKSDFLQCASEVIKAELTLSLYPGGCQSDSPREDCGNDLWSDEIRFGSLSGTRFDEIRTLMGTRWGTVRLNLLSKFPASDILNEIRRTGGVIQMEYADDAIVQFASIELVGR